MNGRRWPGRDRGSFTAELAVGLPALLVLFLAGMAAVSAVMIKAQCLDAAREAALAAARGEEPRAVAAATGPEGADIQVSVGGESVTAVVSARVRVLGGNLPAITVRATAVAAREPEEVPM
ncbi:TadE family type IV pilus minor pilin [Actinoplanes sp. GCM10030250]|uniref:TadE family type IV pilus minor pilin n=1 Tax=Actinoplanes sp. GCM10030250 TaxID=3273376 RepID=UPI00360B9AEB